MKKYVLIFVCALGFSQINWQIEVADSMFNDSGGIGWASLKLDSLTQPRIVYYQAFGWHDTNWVKLIYLYKNDTQWIKETVDSSYGYCATNYYIRPSLCLDKFDHPHIAYVHHKEDNTSILYYANKMSANWAIQKLDSILSSGNSATLCLDTFDYPCITWPYKTLPDTIWRIKYIHWDGQTWNSEIISDGNDFDDYPPSLTLDGKNHPHIVFYQNGDSVKYAYWDGTDWVFTEIDAGWSEHGSLWLALNNLDRPHIAYCKWPALYYAYFDGIAWHTEFTGDAASWEIRLDLDSFGLPHIVYIDQMGQRPEYCYRDSNTWHLCGYIEPDPYVMSYRSVSFCLDDTDKPHVAYIGYDGNWYRMKYALGTFVGVEEDDAGYLMCDTGLKIEVYPSVVQGILNVSYVIPNHGDVEMMIYDVCGRIKKSIKHSAILPGTYRKKIMLRGLNPGVYFLVLKQNNEYISKKFLLVR